MEYNGYKQKKNTFLNDPSYSDPNAGISARGDLNEKYLNLYGGIDFKVNLNNQILDC
jgi:hypothetical protein